MNSLCIVNTLIPHGLGQSVLSDPQEGVAGFVELVRAAVDQGASVLDLGSISHYARTQEIVDRLCVAVSVVRDLYPDTIFQVAPESLFELNMIVDRYAGLAPDIVSIPLAVLCSEAAMSVLDARRHEMGSLRQRLWLDVDDLSFVFRAVRMQHRGLLDGRLRMNFCFGREFGIPSDRDAFLFFVETLRRLAPEATWSGIGYGRSELELARWSIEMGGHCKATMAIGRTPQGAHRAPESVTPGQVVRLCKEYGRRPATFAEARHVLSLNCVTEHTTF
ncbi:MAG TPA: 3-keto-5-aminohexanoate cleavage protein [Pararobbsia sp.]|nr:3-keto-5-aminohexanoate cleavage protein [Pararobbsia sp.]